MNDKLIKYAALLNDMVVDAIQNPENDNFLGDDILNEENATEFFHALATIMPNRLYNKLTGQNIDNIGFNHLANRLCMQFVTFVKADGAGSSEDDDPDSSPNQGGDMT